MVVVLPAPLRPRNPKIEPGGHLEVQAAQRLDAVVVSSAGRPFR